MIKIDLEQRIIDSGKYPSLEVFLDTYKQCLLNHKFQPFSVKTNSTNKQIDDIYSIYPASTVRHPKKINILYLLEYHYNNNQHFKASVDDIYNSFKLKKLFTIEKFFSQLLTCTPETLDQLESRFKKKATTIYTPHVLSIYERIFKYKMHREKFIHLFTDLNFKICYYCNRNYITNFTKSTTIRPTFTLDHFYQQKKYPMLALSFYNLIPSCYTCNSTIKNTRDVEQYKNNYSKNYNFNQDASFKLLGLGTQQKPYELKLSSKNKDIQKYIKDFKHEEIYQVHLDEATDILKKNRDLQDLISKYQSITHTDISKIKENIFGNEIFSVEQDNKPLSKLKQDIARKIKVIT